MGSIRYLLYFVLFTEHGWQPDDQGLKAFHTFQAINSVTGHGLSRFCQHVILSDP